MTGIQFRQTHGDPTTWTTADFETYEHLAEADTLPIPTRDCWFCSAPNPATNTICGFCNHHRDDAPTHTA